MRLGVLNGTGIWVYTGVFNVSIFFSRYQIWRNRQMKKQKQKALSGCFNALLLLLLSHFSRVRLCATPQTAAHQAPPSLGFSRQERWSGVPLPSQKNECSILHFILPSRVINISPHIQSRDFILYLLSERIWKTDVVSGYSYSFYKMSICIYGWTVWSKKRPFLWESGKLDSSPDVATKFVNDPA